MMAFIVYFYQFILQIASFNQGNLVFNQSRVIFDPKAETTVAQFINEMNAFSIKYDPSNRFFIEESLLKSSFVDFTNDIPGYEAEHCQAASYFGLLRKSNVKVYYQKDFTVLECRVGNQLVLGAIVEKEVVSEKQTSKKYEEFFELERDKNFYRIKSISSSLFSSYNKIVCPRENKPTKAEALADNCPVYSLAEEERLKGNYADALRLFRISLECNGIDKTVVEGKIDQLSNAEKTIAAFDKAESLFSLKEYDESLKLFQLVKAREEYLQEHQRKQIDKKIELCEMEISYSNLSHSGNFFYDNGLYDKALPYYDKALTLKPGQEDLMKKKQTCDQKIREKYLEDIKKEIAYSEFKLDQNRDIMESMITLMKYKDSGLLSGKQLFYMAIILDNRPRKVKKYFQLSNRDCCVLTRRFMIQAREKGFRSDNFDYLWFEHFSEESRTCQ